MSLDRELERELDRSILQIRSDNNIIRNDIEHLNKLYNKLESTILKLESTTNKLDTMLSLQEKSIEVIQSLVVNNSSMLDIKLNTQEHENKEKLKTNNLLLEAMLVRLNSLEKSKWILYGGLMGLSIVITIITGTDHRFERLIP